MKKTILRLLLVVAFCATLGFFYSYHLPEFKLWAIERIEKLSQENAPVKVLVANIEFNFFPLGVSLKNIRLTPQKELAEVASESFVRELRLSLNPFSFLTGLFQFSKVEIIDPQITLKDLSAISKLKKADSKDTPLNLKSLLQIPLNALIIHRMDLSIPAQRDIPKINVEDFSLEIENQKTSALISFISPKLTVFDPKIADIPAEVSIGSRILIQDDQILVSALKIKKGESYILAGGYTQAPLSKINFDEVSLKIKTHLQLDQLRKEVIPFFKNVNLPSMEGLVESQTQILKNPQETASIETKLLLDKLKIDRFTIGHVIGQVLYKNDSLQSPFIQVQNSMGKIQFKDLQFKLNEANDYKVNVLVDNVQIQELLKNLGLGEIGVRLEAKTNLPCEGQLKGPSYLKCQGDMDIQKLRVYNPRVDIAKVETGHIKGSVEVTKSQINLNGDLNVGKNSHGHAHGYVNYDKGFSFEYEAPVLDLQEIEIANLDLKGVAKDLKGATQGDSSKATFYIETDAEDFTIKKYFTGSFATRVSYKEGILKIADIDGILRTSKYLGDLSVNLNQSTIKGSLRSPYLELSDLQKAFIQIVTLPIEFYGSGEADVAFSGPLEFNKLSYNLKSRFLNGNIASESFDELVYNVTSKDGHVNADKIYLKKSGGVMTLTGTAEPTGKINTNWAGRNFTLQSLNTFAKSDINIDGDLNFDLSLTDYILKPKSLLTATITKTRISQEKVDDSKFSLSFGKNTIEGNGELFGKKILGKFVFPLSAEAPFSVNAKIDKWDFVPLLHLISSKSRAQEFSTNISGEVNLSSDKNGIWGANGSILAKDFEIQRGIKELQATGPIEIQFVKGHADIHKFTLRGDNTSLEVSSNKNSKSPINVTLNGKIDIGLLSFLTPFLDDLKGVLAITSQISFNSGSWNFAGSGFLDQGYIRTETLPHTFDDVQADLLFNDNKILINKISSDFAGGKITGSGSVEIKGINNLKTDITGKFQNFTLRIPKDVISKGSGDFHFYGNWFPYVLQGTYFIQSGLFTKQLNDDDKSQSSFSRLQLLPESLVKKNNELLLLDMDLIFSKGVDVKNDIIESKAYGQLHMKGPPAQPNFSGQIQFQRNGKIFFNDSTFEIETGELKFNDPNKINPDIYISANTTAESVDSNRVQHYDINMLVQGKADKYNINLTSSPPLDQKDIISLLALGVSSESTLAAGGNQNQFSESQVSKQSYGVGASILTKNKFGRDLQNKTGVQVKVSTSVDQVTNTTSPKITLSKQWTPKIQTSTSRTFGDLTTQDVKVEYQFNKNLSLIGSWVGQETSTTNQTSQNATNINDKTKTTDFLGLDLEYKFEFK